LHLDNRLGCEEEHPEILEGLSRIQKTGPVAGGERNHVGDGYRRERAVAPTGYLLERRQGLLGYTQASGVVICNHGNGQLAPIVSRVGGFESQVVARHAVSNRVGTGRASLEVGGGT